MTDIRYPIGNQDFEKIRQTGRVYIDKTQFIPKLVDAGDYIFLSRPRRFGKSLLLSTIEAFFRGQKHLFEGLAIDSLIPDPWTEYPVLRLDLSGSDYKSEEALISDLSSKLSEFEKLAGCGTSDASLSERLRRVLIALHDLHGQKVVVLVDEYDNPITQAIGNDTLHRRISDILHGFYSILKACDAHIQFCMLSGVTRYGKLSVFSGLNNLRDISFDNEFAGICGITEEELHTQLLPGVEHLAQAEGISVDDAFRLLKNYYDGYHFSKSMLDVYNPYSLISALASKEVKSFWYATATPTMLVNALASSRIEPDRLNGVRSTEDALNNISSLGVNPVALFYQTGYLTLKQYDKVYKEFVLGFPNKEVENGFKQNLLSAFTRSDSTAIFINDLRRTLDSGNTEEFIKLLRAFLADIPLKLRRNLERYENYYHTVFYSVFTLLGLDATAEYGTSEGYIDVVIKTPEYIYVIELKINGNANDAMAQINRREYAAPFTKDGRKIIKLGIGFAESTHNIDSYVVETVF